MHVLRAGFRDRPRVALHDGLRHFLPHRFLRRVATATETLTCMAARRIALAARGMSRLVGAVAVSVAVAALLAAPGSLAGQGAFQDWDVTLPRGEVTTVDFETDQGTWMSVDLSADGEWITFDLLGHVYRMPASGGEAESLTQSSGIATNFHPRFSPDGSRIAFVSDRLGQSDLWVMDADGSNPRPVFAHLDVRVMEPAWTPDGAHIVVRQQALAGAGVGSGIWRYPVDGPPGPEGFDAPDGVGHPSSPAGRASGSGGVALVGGNQGAAAWPSLSRDGRYLYYHLPVAASDVVEGGWELRRLELEEGRVSALVSGRDQAQYRGSSGSGYAPEISPDGRWLAFARRIPGGTISWKGNRFGPRTALFLRDLRSGAERMVMDPIEMDMAEGIKVMRVLPGYAWSADGRHIVLSQGGRIRRLEVESGRVETIPFNARVLRTVSEQARGRYRISDGPVEVRFPRWASAPPEGEGRDGEGLVFQAVGRLWIQGPGGAAPTRLTPETFEPLEYTPAWSPDGRWIAFTSWDDEEGGHLWRIPREGGDPERLTGEPGEYVNPVWGPDGASLLVSRGSGATARGRSMANNPWYELVRVPIPEDAVTAPAAADLPILARVSTRHDGGAQAGGRRHILRASFGPDGRVFFPEEAPPDSAPRGVVLVSTEPDGSDRRVHARFPFAEEVVPSPDGRWLAFAEAFNVYLAPMPQIDMPQMVMTQGAAGNRATDLPVLDRRAQDQGVERLTLEGGISPRWRDSESLEFSSGTRYFVHRPGTGQTDTTQVHLSVPRAMGTGSLALTGARILTMERDPETGEPEVIQRGTVVVRDGRIACVGDCATEGVDRVMEVGGATLLPGFVDPHAHHHREHSGILPRKNFEAAVYLAYGVTTTMDPIGWSPAVFPEAEMIEAGVTVGPRVFSTGENLAGGDRARTNAIESYADAEHEINRLTDWGAVAVKQYAQPYRQQRQWIADISRRKGLMVTGEGSDLSYNVGTTLDGQTGWEHPLSYVPLYPDVARFFGRAGAVYSPTLVVGGPGAWNEEYFWQEEDLWTDPKQQRWLPWRHLIPHTRRRTLRPVTDYSFPLLAQGLDDIIAEGGMGAIGSHGQHHGIGTHWEIWMLASAMESIRALEVATIHGARFLGMEEDLGSLRPGKLADLLVLDADPLQEIRNSQAIRYVMKAGILYHADTLDEIWPTERPYGALPWLDEDMLQVDDRPVDGWDSPPPPR